MTRADHVTFAIAYALILVALAAPFIVRAFQ